MLIGDKATFPRLCWGSHRRQCDPSTSLSLQALTTLRKSRSVMFPCARSCCPVTISNANNDNINAFTKFLFIYICAIHMNPRFPYRLAQAV